MFSKLQNQMELKTIKSVKYTEDQVKDVEKSLIFGDYVSDINNTIDIIS